MKSDDWNARAWRPSPQLLWALGFVFAVLACTLADRRDVGVQEWWSQRGPVVPHDSFPADCSLCHEGGDWLTIREDFVFDHSAETGVPLEGAHAYAECLRCHNDRGPVLAFAARGCVGCHENVHRGQLGEGCESCHNETDWRPKEQIALHNRTGFPLIGAHAATACWRCHEGADTGVFSRADRECVTCHAPDLARALDPDHAAQGWTSDCDRCHIPTSWQGADFNHSTFPLVGLHRAVDCSQCHVGGVFGGTPTQCVDCHLADYQATNDPDHSAASFPTGCESCHTPSGWGNADFDHLSWPLTGAHRTTDCSACHVGNVFMGTPNQCVDCHLAEYQATNDPDHLASGFPTACDSCHSTVRWAGANFNHSFPINNGPHRNLDCMECHRTPGDFNMFSCIDCHEHRRSEVDDEHSDVDGYVYLSSACLACHPNGR